MPKVIKNKKLTDEEIIKDLTELSRYTGFQEKYIQVLNATLDLINRQKSEIERLKSANDEKFRQWDMLAEKTKTHYADLYNEAKDKLKAEACKEFAERLNGKAQIADCFNSYSMVVGTHFIDNLLKEMVGEEE